VFIGNQKVANEDFSYGHEESEVSSLPKANGVSRVVDHLPFGRAPTFASFRETDVYNSLAIGGRVKSVMYGGLQLAGAPRDLAASAAVTVMIGDLEA
jgi:hypothetical protein